MPIVEAHLILPVGTADDPKAKSGLATLTATLLDKGTESLTATQFAEALEALGVKLQVAAGADETTVGFSAVTRNLEPALALAGQMLAHPRFEAKDVERERDLQLADLLQGPDSVGWIARRAFPILLFGADHPYGNPAEGYPDTVKSITVDDARSFYTGHVSPAGATLVIVGDVEAEPLFAMLEKTLANWTGEPAERRAVPPVETKAERGVAYLVDKPGAVQSVLAVGRRWVDRSDPRYFATLLGNRILGADFLSRLNQNLREKNGYSYGAGSAFHYRRQGSTWLTSTSVRADATAPALKEVISELDAVASGGQRPLTTDEIDIARGAEARSFPETFESPSGITGILAEMAQFHLPLDYLDTFLHRLQSTRPDAISKAMEEVVTPEERIILVVGDRREVEPKLKGLGFKEVRLVTPDGRLVKP